MALGKSVRAVTLIHMLSHFAVDFACVYTVLQILSPNASAGLLTSFVVVLTYDFLAFCLQVPVGAILDKIGSKFWRLGVMVAEACVALGLCLSLFVPYGFVSMISLLLISVGNALFHSAAAEDVISLSNGRSGPLGAYVSTGAIGVVLGSWGGLDLAGVCLGLLVVCIILCALLGMSDVKSEGKGSIPASSYVVMFALLVIVAMRSHVGFACTFPWKSPENLVMFVTCTMIAVPLGKLCGGYLSDKFGRNLVCVSSLVTSAMLFVPGWDIPVLGILGTFLFNFSMSIVTSELVDTLLGRPGLAFGLASGALFVGFFISMLFTELATSIGVCVLSLLSAVLFYVVMWLNHGRGKVAV